MHGMVTISRRNPSGRLVRLARMSRTRQRGGYRSVGNTVFERMRPDASVVRHALTARVRRRSGSRTRPATLPAADRPTSPAISPSSAAATRGLWTALLAKRENPARARRAARGPADRLGRIRPQRRLLRSQPHPRRRERAQPVPAGVRPAAAARPGEPRRDRAHRRRAGARCRLRAQRRDRHRHRAPPGRVAARGGERRRRRLPRHRCRARAGQLAHATSPDCSARATPRSCTRPSSPARSPAPASSRRRDLRAHPGAESIGDGTDAPHPARHRARRRTALATNVFPSLLKRNRLATVPVYDYVLMTEPLTDAQLASIGWSGRQGLGDSANQFHYYRLSADNRILFGGYDAIYHYGGRVREEYENRPATFERLAEPLLHDVPAAGGHPVHQQVGGRHRHLQPVLRVLRLRARRPRRLRDRLTPGSGSQPPISAPRSCSTCSPGAAPSAPSSRW